MMDKHILTTALARYLSRSDFSLAGDDSKGYTLYFADGRIENGSSYDLQSIYSSEEIIKNKVKRIIELKQLLNDSDYKVLPDYDKPSEEIKAQRQAWREEIRTLEAQA